MPNPKSWSIPTSESMVWVCSLVSKLRPRSSSSSVTKRTSAWIRVSGVRRCRWVASSWKLLWSAKSRVTRTSPSRNFFRTLYRNCPFSRVNWPLNQSTVKAASM